MTTRDNCPAYLADDLEQQRHWLALRRLEQAGKALDVATSRALEARGACSGCGYHVCDCGGIRTYTSDPGEAVLLGGADWHGALKGALKGAQKVNPAEWRREYLASFEVPGRFFPATARADKRSPRTPEAIAADVRAVGESDAFFSTAFALSEPHSAPEGEDGRSTGKAPAQWRMANGVTIDWVADSAEHGRCARFAERVWDAMFELGASASTMVTVSEDMGTARITATSDDGWKAVQCVDLEVIWHETPMKMVYQVAEELLRLLDLFVR